MGVGNFCLSNTIPHRTVYVDYDQIYIDENNELIDPEKDIDAWRCAFADFVEMVQDCMSKAYKRKCEHKKLSEAGTIIGESAHFLVSVVEWETYIAVSVEAKPLPNYELSFHPFTDYTVKTSALALFMRMVKKGFKLRIRSCAWRSKPYNPFLE